MKAKSKSALSRFWSGRTISASPFDLAVIIVMVCAGLIFLWDAPGWAPHVYVGNEQFGDAEFWWRGALQFSQGVFWDNVNFYYRMGYAIFAGLLVAVAGTDYAVFHKLLLLLFLGVAVGGYLVLARRVGRPAALAMTASLIFSPYQAEWLAI
jgi:ABC-type Na+ efflux pump permease subunit